MDHPVTVHVDFGRQGLSVDVPAGVRTFVLDYGRVAALERPGEAVAAALRKPVGSAPLPDLARGKGRCCIVVSDKTRPVPNALILPAILDALASAGMDADRVTILVGTGIHSPTTGAALEETLGAEVLRRCRVVNHEPRNPARNVSVGRTGEGIEVFVNRLYVQSDLKIVTGLIEPHFMAGYSGGSKGICPAICGYETVKHFHSVARLAHRASATGRLTGNPVHAMATETARMVGVDFLVNVTLDAARWVTGVFAGDVAAAHEAGVAFLRRYAVATVPQPVDIALTGSAGYPLDTTFYQAAKGMLCPYDIVKPGGTAIVAAECAEGEGSAEYRDLLDRIESPEQIMALLREPGFYQIDQWNIQEMCKALARYEVFFVCETIAPERLRRWGVRPFASVRDALRAALAKHGAHATLAAIPKGPYVEARLASSRGV